MSAGTLAIICGLGALAWATVLHKGRVLWRNPRDPAIWVYWSGFLLLAATLTLPLPPVFRWIDGLVGLKGFAYLLADLAGLLACWTWLAYLYRLNTPDPVATPAIRRLALIVAAALGFMVVRFAVAPGRLEHQLGPDRITVYMALYRLVFLGVMGLHFAHAIPLLRNYAAVVPRPALRARLRLMAWAGGFGLGFVVYESLRVIPPPLPEVGGALLMLMMVLLLVASFTLGAWLSLWRGLERRWSALTAARDWFERFRVCRRLYPLWRALYPVNPSLSFLPAPAPFGVWLLWGDVSFCLWRQVIEIRDWSLELRPYQVPEVAGLAEELGRRAGLAPTDLPLLVEAARLAAALHAWHQAHLGNAPNPPVVQPDNSAEDRVDVLPEGIEPRNEMADLLRVAEQFAHSPLVRTVVTRLDDRTRSGVPTGAAF